MTNKDAFLGRGWSFPPAFSKSGADVAMVSGIEDIHQSLQILLSTRLGERVMQENFGCELQDFLFEEVNHNLVISIKSVISDAILYHEPRITLEHIDISESADHLGLLLISLTYTIRGTNSRFNMVYPFYIDEANI